MSIETHTDPNAEGHGGFERKDITSASVIYFFVALAIVALLIHFLLAGMYKVLDSYYRSDSTASPLVTNVPKDTRAVAPGYPEQVFPNPRLEQNERTQLDDIRLQELQKLNSYGWVDQQGGVVRIPIERAMDLVVQRGLPVAPENNGTPGEAAKAGTAKKGNQ